MGDVVILGNLTRLNIPPERVLEAAKEASLTGVVVVGWASDGSEYFASSIADGGEVIWLIERAKKRLLEMADK